MPSGTVRPSVREPWAMPAGEVARRLGSDPAAGLDAADAARRLAEDGPNDLPRPARRGLAASVGDQLRETMIVVLLGAAVLTAATGDVADCAVILFVIAVNTTVGVLQERRALGAVAALRALAVPRARVVRDGTPQWVDASTVVRGDVLSLAEGDAVVADARLVESHDLQVDEAALTGESQPSPRDADARCPADAPTAERTSMVHAGSLVAHGTGRAVATATGAESRLGAIAAMLREHEPPPTPLQRRLARLGRSLSLAAAVGCAVVAGLGLLRGQPWELTLLSGISLAVAAIPESLPAVVALALAAATRRMTAAGAIVRTLPAVEALGSVTVLAVDKTGTLTSGRISCTALWTPADGVVALPPPDGLPAAARRVLEAGCLCNDAEAGATGTEGAIVAAAAGAGLDVAGLRRDRPRTAVVPFDAARRVMRTRHDGPGGELAVAKGAPEVLLPGFGPDRAAAAAVVEAWTGEGGRVLAVSVDGPGPAREHGLLRLVDPVRPDAAPAVRAARAAGIRTVMITGDHPATAAAVARAVGITDEPDEPPGDGDAPLRRIYARTDPAGKLDIVAAWQRAGHLVAMTGDGVNDAPALRAADVGVAMGRRGTEVAKEAAGVVLTDDGLGTIVAAIAEGRRVADNVRRFVRYGLSGGVAEILVMLVGPFLGLGLPLLPAQVLWVNLVTHGLPGVAIGSEAAEPDVLDRPPRPPREGILTRRTVGEVAVLAALITACCLVLATAAAATGHPWQTMLFVTLATAQLGVALTTRSDRTPVWRLPVRTNPFLYLAVVASLGATAAAVYTPLGGAAFGTVPLGPGEVAVSLAVAAVPALAVELVELRRDRVSRRRPPGRSRRGGSARRGAGSAGRTPDARNGSGAAR